MTELREQIHQINSRQISHREVATAMHQFDPVWEALTPREQCRVIQLLVERVDYDGNKGTVAVTFHPEGIRNFGDEIAVCEEAI